MKFDIASALAATNADLSLVQLCLRGERVYVRGRKFPPKPGHTKSRQYEIPLGFKLNVRTIKIAQAKARRIESDLILDTFDWGDWIEKFKKAETVRDWVKKFEADYWNKREKTINRQNTWEKNYRYFFRHLSQDAELTLDLLVDQAIAYPPETRIRQQCCIAFGALAQFAGIPREPIAALGKGWKHAPKPQDHFLPDAEIEAKILGAKMEKWRWIAGMAAAFGLRNHEIFKTDRSRISEGVIKVFSDTKTGARLVVAYPLAWVELFGLTNKPSFKFDIEGKSNANIGARISKGMRRHGLPGCYQLRDCYGLRLRKAGVLPDIRARYMGHSAAVHETHYMDATQDQHLEEFYRELLDL